MKKQIFIQVQRAQSYATVRDSGSYNYRFSETPVSLLHEDNVWEATRCGTHEAREAFIEFVKSRGSKRPDFSQAISHVQAWLDEHGEKDGAWANTVAQYKADLTFLKGGYKDFALMYEPVKVVYVVRTLPAYSLGTFDKQVGGKHIPFPPGNPDTFEWAEKGFLKTINYREI